MVPEIKGTTDKIFFGHFWPYSALLPTNSLENQNLEKMKKRLEMSSFYRYATKFIII